MILTITAILAIGIIICAFYAIYTREEKIKELQEKVEDIMFWANNYSELLSKTEEENERLRSTIKDDTELISQLNRKLKAKKK